MCVGGRCEFLVVGGPENGARANIEAHSGVTAAALGCGGPGGRE